MDVLRQRRDAVGEAVGVGRQAARRPTPRKATRPSKATKERRLDEKSRRGAIKRLRRKRPNED